TLPDPLPEQLLPLGPRRYFLSVKMIDFESLTRGSNIYPLASTAKLNEILNSPETRRLAPVAVIFHMRFTRPLVGLTVVVLGLAIIVRDQNRHVLASAGLGPGVCAICAVLCHG